MGGGEFCVGGGGCFFPLPGLDFVWVLMGCVCPWWWWLVAGLGLNFLKTDFLHPIPNRGGPKYIETKQGN